MGMKRLAGICLSLILCVGMLAGCGTLVSSDDDLVYVDKKGKVTSIDVEDLDASYYDEDELNSFVKDEIDQYTAENGKGTVSLKDLKVEDGKAKLTMEYKTPEDYAAFNGIELYQGKIVRHWLPDMILRQISSVWRTVWSRKLSRQKRFMRQKI